MTVIELLEKENQRIIKKFCHYLTNRRSISDEWMNFPEDAHSMLELAQSEPERMVGMQHLQPWYRGIIRGDTRLE